MHELLAPLLMSTTSADAPKLWLSLIFRAKLRQIGQGLDGVTDQIQPVHRIGI